MTNREFYNAVISAAITEEVTAKAAEMIAALDAKNEKRKAPTSKEKTETAARREIVFTTIQAATTPMNREEIAFVTGLTVGQVTAACTALIKDGKVVKTQVKVEKGKKTVYAIML